LAADYPVATDDDRAFRLREGVEGAFEGSQGVRAFDRLHDALFGGGFRGPIGDHVTGSWERGRVLSDTLLVLSIIPTRNGNTRSNPTPRHSSRIPADI
jgi:hypothetical protein